MRVRNCLLGLGFLVAASPGMCEAAGYQIAVSNERPAT